MAALSQPQSEPLHDGGHQAGHRDATGVRRRAGRPCAPRGPHLRRARGRRTTRASSAEGQVDQEHPAPADLHQQAADGGPEGGCRAPDGRPQTDGGALALGAEGGQEQSEGGRAASSAPPVAWSTRAPTRKPSDGRQRAQGGRGGEDGQADEEGLLAPGPVGPAPGGDEGGREDDRVGAEHPRQRAEALAVEGGEMLGKAMLTMNRSREDRNTPVSTIRAVRPGAGRARDADGCRPGLSELCHEMHCKKKVA